MFDFFLYRHPISNSFGALDFIYTPIIDNSSKLVRISAAVHLEMSSILILQINDYYKFASLRSTYTNLLDDS
jgi:hypothetical protein